MKNRNITNIFIITLIVLVTYSNIPVKGGGLGVGPSYIVIDDALRNSTYTQTIYIYNENEFDSEITFEHIGETKEWTKLYEDLNCESCENNPLESIFIKNMTTKQIFCEITVPGDAANGLYNGSIDVMSQPAEISGSNGTQSSVGLNMPVLISINVTGDEIYNLSVESIDFEDKEINYPANIKIKFKNLGNVEATPTVDITITKDDFLVDKITKTSRTKPGQISSLELEWNTIGKVSGEYNAYFKIYQNENIIHEQNITFELFSPGSFTREGIIEEITYEGDLSKGKVVKIISVFLNSGNIETKAKFFGEIYLNNELVGTIESPETLVPKYEQRRFVTYLTLNENGEYLISGYFNYEGRTTETKELKFTVGANLGNIILPFVIILILIVIIYYLIKSGILQKKEFSFFNKNTSGKLFSEKSKIENKNLNFDEEEQPIEKEKRKIRFKKKDKKPASFSIEDMTAKEIEEYVKGL